MGHGHREQADAGSIYRYMNFDQIEEYATVAKSVSV